MPKIFISYRRDDSEAVTGRIYDPLESHFGRDNLFMDVDSIPRGVDFRQTLDRAVSESGLLLAVIGPRWLNASFGPGPRQGGRRLDDPEDYVRAEIESALARGVPVLPVLVGGARMPEGRELPGASAALAFQNAAEV